MPPSPSPELSDTENSHKVPCVSVQLQYAVRATVEPGKGKKTTKPKLETKNKEFAFRFEATAANYLHFLSTILIAHDYKKYTPVTIGRKFSIQVGIPPKKTKKDALAIDKYQEYEELATKIVKLKTPNLVVFVSLEHVKECHKRRASDDHQAGSSGDNEEEGTDADTSSVSLIDSELGRLRGLLEKQYKNPTDDGYTFVSSSGDKIPLTPILLKQWSRAMFDGTATKFLPPNTMGFDPAARERSLFSKTATSARGEEGTLAHVSSILQDVRALCSDSRKSYSDPPSTPSAPASDPSRAQLLASPPTNTPSKLTRYLEHAEMVLGVKNATHYEASLGLKGYGPDILSLVNDADLIECGLTPGDAIRLKRGADPWWSSSDAKKPKSAWPTTPSPTPDYLNIRFEKRFVEGGSHSVFGSGLTEGFNPRADEHTWWYYNNVTKKLEIVPDGLVPVLDPESADALADEAAMM